MPAFNTIALIGRYHSPDVATALATMGEYLRRQGRAVLLEKETAATNGVSGFPIADYDEIGARADLVVVQGGDGSMLNAARNLAAHHVPLVGVNQGRLGFMTDIASSNMLHAMAEILAGRRPDSGDAHGVDRLRAFIGRADTATERARVRVGADLPAHAVQPAHHGQRPHRDRNLPEALDRCPASLRRAAAVRPSGGRPRRYPARGAYRQVRPPPGLQLLRDVAPEAALERSALAANAFASIHSGLCDRRSYGTRVSAGFYRSHR